MENVFTMELMLSIVFFILAISILVFKLSAYEWTRDGNTFTCVEKTFFINTPIEKVLLRIKKIRELSKSDINTLKKEIVYNKIKIDTVLKSIDFKEKFNSELFKKNVKNEMSFERSFNSYYKFEYRFECNRITIKAKNRFNNDILWSVNYYYNHKFKALKSMCEQNGKV